MFLPNIVTPKGNAGMTSISTHNDDTVVTFPDIGFDFKYNNIACRTTISTSGNSMVSFSGGTEQLLINRRDAGADAIYWAKETVNDSPTFRIRWEGHETYNAWGTLNLVWELTLFNDNAMMLVIEKIPNTAASSFVNPTLGTTALTLAANQSYAFIPQAAGGTAYTVQAGSYITVTIKYLIDDGSNGIKAWNGTTWAKVADGPVTEDTMKTYGTPSLNISRAGLVLTNPTVYMWTDYTTVVNHSLHTVAIPTPKLIKQIVDYNIPTGVSSVVLTATVTSTSFLKVVCSVDGGVSWCTWNGSAWSIVDVTSIGNVKSSGVSMATLNAITAAQWLLLVGTKQTIRFAYYLEQVNLSDVCSLDTIRVNYK